MINKIAKNPRLGSFQIGKLTADKFNELLDYQKPITLVDESTINWNLRKGYNAKVILTANRTLALSNLTAGDYFTLEVVQGGIGSYTLTLPTGTKVANDGAGIVTLSTTVGAVDLLTFYYNGVTLFCTYSTNFS